MLTGLCSRRAKGKSEVSRLEASRCPPEPGLAGREFAAAHCRGGALTRSWPTALPHRSADTWHLARGHERLTSVLHSAPSMVAGRTDPTALPKRNATHAAHPSHELPQASPGFILSQIFRTGARSSRWSEPNARLFELDAELPYQARMAWSRSTIAGGVGERSLIQRGEAGEETMSLRRLGLTAPYGRAALPRPPGARLRPG